MDWSQIIWDLSPGGNVEHIEEHDLTTDDVDQVLQNYESKSVSRSSGRPCLRLHSRRKIYRCHLRGRKRIGSSSHRVRGRRAVVEGRKMARRKPEHVNRHLSEKERARHAEIRDAVMKDFPPKASARRKASPPGIPARIRQAREAQGLT